ncbi:hypothetical protein [Corynebacterium cystitidis]|uniref:hypothetical protein n=1 Tax=Corynebacterium cystitidis TaxID=35757 RepID=UPI00211F2CF0|nr:hypothetical protein [Corynebacterium cystitidis]
MKKTTSIVAALAVSASLIAAPQANAQGEDTMSNQPPEHTATGSAYSGSAPLSILLVALGVAAVAKLITDNLLPLRETIDQFAADVGPSGSSGSSEATRQ